MSIQPNVDVLLRLVLGRNARNEPIVAMYDWIPCLRVGARVLWFSATCDATMHIHRPALATRLGLASGQSQIHIHPGTQTILTVTEEVNLRREFASGYISAQVRIANTPEAQNLVTPEYIGASLKFTLVPPDDLFPCCWPNIPVQYLGSMEVQPIPNTPFVDFEAPGGPGALA